MMPSTSNTSCNLTLDRKEEGSYQKSRQQSQELVDQAPYWPVRYHNYLPEQIPSLPGDPKPDLESSFRRLWRGFNSQEMEKKRVLQRFFKQAVANNDVKGLSKLMQENIEELGELCESLEVSLLRATLPQTADTLLTWGVTHNKYELVKFVIEEGRAHITNNLGDCRGQTVTKIAAQKGYQKLFRLLIDNGVDVDTRNITAFMSAIICGQYRLARIMVGLGEYRLEQRNKNGDTPQDCLDEKQFFLEISGDKEDKEQKEALEALLHRKIKTMKMKQNILGESQPLLEEEQHTLQKKEQ
ncbi:MAG: ankyrin repeat domain-containing protein [Bacteroidota bacterium]